MTFTLPSLGASPFARRGRVWYKRYTRVVPMSRMWTWPIRLQCGFARSFERARLANTPIIRDVPHGNIVTSLIAITISLRRTCVITLVKSLRKFARARYFGWWRGTERQLLHSTRTTRVYQTLPLLVKGLAPRLYPSYGLTRGEHDKMSGEKVSGWFPSRLTSILSQDIPDYMGRIRRGKLSIVMPKMFVATWI